MVCSPPAFPVRHGLLEFAQTHVHWISDAIQPSHPLPLSSPFAFSFSQHQSLFQWVGSSIRWLKYWRFSISIIPSNEYLGLISFKIDWFDLLAVKGFSTVFSSTTIQIFQARIFQIRILEQGAISSSRGSSQHRNLLYFLYWQVHDLGSPYHCPYSNQIKYPYFH